MFTAVCRVDPAYNQGVKTKAVFRGLVCVLCVCVFFEFLKSMFLLCCCYSDLAHVDTICEPRREKTAKLISAFVFAT